MRAIVTNVSGGGTEPMRIVPPSVDRIDLREKESEFPAASMMEMTVGDCVNAAMKQRGITAITHTPAIGVRGPDRSVREWK